MNSKKQILMAFASFLAGHAAECERGRKEREGEYKVNGLNEKQRYIDNMRDQEFACGVVNNIVQAKIKAMDRPAPVEFDHRKYNRGEAQ